jgi:anti-sigma regulatory factor (Ser/Thr protein kinase)
LSVQHEAYLYRDLAEFVAAAQPFVEEGVAANETVLVAVRAQQIDALRSVLACPDGVVFADMVDLGRNPTRIIAAWREFIQHNVEAGRGIRGIGEPIWPGRTAAELLECQRNEALLNIAFADGPNWRLMCPYNIDTLPPAVIEEALTSHPVIARDGVRTPSDRYEPSLARLDGPLPAPPPDAAEVAFTVADLPTLRSVIATLATRANLHPDRAAELLLAVHEMAVNSIQHGGGEGLLRAWLEQNSMVCEVTDHGWAPDPLTGRERPPAAARHGRGLWLASEWCDLVQWRSWTTGTLVRLHMMAGNDQMTAPMDL